MLAQSAIFDHPGQFESLRFADVPLSAAASGEVEIEVEAVALNFKDVLLALGLMPAADAAFGFECAGVIRRMGPGVTHLTPGDSVVAIGNGCLATRVRVDAATVCRRPRHLTAQQAVTMPVAFVTASYALEELARLRAADRVLIHAATGGVGLAAVQIARRIGAEIYATAGSDEKRQYLRSLGVRHVMNSRTPDFAAEILAATSGGGVDVILNSLSGDLMERSLTVLAAHGRFVELGARDAIAGHTLALSAFRRGATFCSVGYEGPIPGLGERLTSVMERASRGEIEPLPSSMFAREQAGEAFAYLASAKHIGKVGVVVQTVNEDSSSTTLLTPAEGVRLFELCLSGTRANFVISKTPLAQRLATAAAVRVLPTPLPAVAKQLHPRPPLDAAYIAPRTEMEVRIAGAWQQHFNLELIGVDDDFFELGGDSLLAVQVVHSMRAALGVDAPAHLILENPTIAEVAAQLDTKPASKPAGTRHLVQLAKGPASVAPIFLVHPIGGHVYFYLPLAKRLAQSATIFGIQAQGVDGEAEPLTTIEAMATLYIAAIRTVQPSGPYRIAGSSFGGTVCFEMARQLEQAGDSLELLALIDSPTPSSLTSFFRSDAEILAYVLARGEGRDQHLERLSAMPEDDMLRYFLTHGGAGTELSSSATVESVRHFLGLFRANYRALATYSPRPLRSKGVFFYATDHDSFNTDGFGQAWRPYFEKLDLVAVDGNHTSINLPPRHDRIVERILADLVQKKA